MHSKEHFQHQLIDITCIKFKSMMLDSSAPYLRSPVMEKETMRKVVIFLGWVSAVCFLQCFDTVYWITGRASSIGANPSTTRKWRGPKDRSPRPKGQRVKLEWLRGVGFLGRGCSCPRQLPDLLKRCKLPQWGLGQAR